MSVYILEINGRGIAAVNAGSELEANEWFRGEPFKEDLMSFGVWDGETELFVREALPEEFVKWQASRDRARAAGEIDHQEDKWPVFLVPVGEG
jgi:hypothetical protein